MVMVFDTGTVWSRVQFHLSQRFTFMKPDAQHKPSGGWGNLWPMLKKSNLSDWSRCRVLILNGSWLIMHRPWNWPTVRPLHSAVYNMCGTWEPKIWTFSETLFGEVRGWKTVRWPYRYLGRRQSLNICVNPSSCESRIRFPWDCV